MLLLGNGDQRARGDLEAIVRDAQKARSILMNLHSRYPRSIVEQAAIAGALTPSLLDDQQSARGAADYIVKRLDRLSDDLERGWSAEVSQSGYVFRRELRGVPEVYEIDLALLNSTEARRLDQMAGSLQEIYAKHALFRRKDGETVINGPLDLMANVLETGRKGLSLQRYKGLGEMNPEQLWETTLDREVRSLLQVKLGALDEADECFRN